MEDRPFVTGVNYWPRTKAMYWWSSFDASEVEDDFDLISSLGMAVVRIFLLWEDWQPEPDVVSPVRMADLGRVLDIAASRGLALDVTFFTGHMSGPNWVPGWLLEPGTSTRPAKGIGQVVTGKRSVDIPYRNMFHDPVALEAEKLLLRTVIGEYHDHEAVWMWNLGNEPDLFAEPHSEVAGQLWVTEMTDLVHSIDADHPVTTGLHASSLFDNNGLRVDQVFGVSDMAVMHGYPMYVPWARHELDPDFVPFLCALVSALTGKPCLAEEWGGCTSPDTEEAVMWTWDSYGRTRAQYMAGEVQLADFVSATLPRLVEVGATGAILWCFADYAPELWDRPPCEETGAKHERHFGLVRPDGSLKPHADVIRDFNTAGPVVRPAQRNVALQVSPDEYYRHPLAHARDLYERF